MCNNTEEKKIKEQLYDVFEESYIEGAGYLVYSLAEAFYKKNNLEDFVYFDKNIFSNCLMDILVDIARLKDFHDIKYVNQIKLIAYTASWCLKRKPFQLVEGCDEKYIYINEMFALSLLTQAVGFLDDDSEYKEENRKIIVKNINSIFYHLKYRNTNPQTLELLLIGIQTGQMVNVSD